MRFKVTVSYDGSNYKGWQSQPHGHSVQQAIEEGLSKMHRRPIAIVASGRTDAGVHATGQVFHFDSDLVITLDKWRQAINCNTPYDIYIHKVEEVDEEFHARFSCTKKKYEYRFSLEPYFNVHRYKYCTQIKYPLDIEKMQHAVNIFIGEHDFTSYCANTLEESPDQVRTIYDINFRKELNEWVVTFYGDGFLRYMVRMIMGTLFAIGQGMIDEQTALDWLEAKDKKLCRFNAEPNGLYLTNVYYD